MKAFQFADVQTGLQLADLSRPKPGHNQVLIEVKAAGLCHSDCFILKDERHTLIKKRPITLGHEVAGIIVETGSGVSDYQIGERIVSGITSHPVSAQNWHTAIGLGYDGGYAELAIVYTANICRIPCEVTFAQAAVATDSISTAYHAVVTEGLVGASTRVGIVGLGGLGLAGAQIAVLRGAKVYGIDLDTYKFIPATKFGVVDCAQSLDVFSNIPFDVIIDFAGAGVTTAYATKSVKAGGKVVLVGLAATTSTLDTHDMVTRNIALQGSIGASKDELRTVLKLIAEGKLSPLLTEIPFLGLPKGIEQLETGEVTGRLFTDPSKLHVEGL